ncbi:hypothetical protein C4571_03025 [Candidatus Parcubacteria bacterium]|nr:MAG: hypothetical protein C4571_03025 [Candidatus Parcubacteria bacterium]
MTQELNPQQKLAVQAAPGPLLIIAGAGTGKTRTLTSRVIYLLEQGVPGSQVCALTFTNKASREMSERIQAALPKEFGGRDAPLITTFHSLGARILRIEGRHFGRSPKFTIFDDHDAISLLRKIMKRNETKLNEGPAFFAKKVAAIKNGVLSFEDLRTSKENDERNIVPVFEKYERALAENDAFDFDDLIQKTVELLRKESSVLEKYRKTFQHILVDEYQDLNPLQYELIRLLAGGHKNISVVGDDHQMIYGWRYANLDSFLNFETDWPDARVVLLEENYRSTKTILQAASTVIAHNIRQKPKVLWTKNDLGAPIRIVETNGENEEAEWIAEDLEKVFRHTNQNELFTAAILYRTNAQSRALEQALIGRGIPYRIFGSLKFYERREIKDIVAALRYASNHNDSVSKERLEKNLPGRKYKELVRLLATHRDYAPTHLIQEFLRIADYFSWLDKNFTNAGDRRENVSELISFAERFTSLSEFLETVSLLQATDIGEKKNQVAVENGREALKNKQKVEISLMTIHLAKGLEFDRVYLAGTNEGLLPHNLSLRDSEELEEERRLLYVAMTRAKREFTALFYDVPSRFLSELPGEITAFESRTGNEREISDEERYITFD